MYFPFGLLVAGVAAILVLFGTAQRFLDRVRLNRALLFTVLLLCFIGCFLPPVTIFGVRFNIGGFLVPFAAAFILMLSFGFSQELLRILSAVAASGLATFLLALMFQTNNYLVSIAEALLIGGIAAVICYAITRTASGALCAAVLGTLLGDVLRVVVERSYNVAIVTPLGMGALFDTMVVASVATVLFAFFFARNKAEKPVTTHTPSKIAASPKSVGAGAEFGEIPHTSDILSPSEVPAHNDKRTVKAPSVEDKALMPRDDFDMKQKNDTLI